MKYLTLTLFSILILAYFPCKSQTTDTIVEHRLGNYLTHNLQEKIYAHTDKNVYLAGEIIWFKLYNVEAYTNCPIKVSKIAYVELLDDNNKIIAQAKISLREGESQGHIYLPISLKPGNLLLRAYTNWMKNFDVSLFFHKELTLYNTLKADSLATTTSASLKPAIQFFPEGGNLVHGLNSKVAFKAVDENGKALEFSGAILNDKNDTIVKFNPKQFGLGSFNFLPIANQNYRAYINPKFGNSFYAVLPAIFDKGVVMTVNTAVDSSLKINIQHKLQNPQNYILFVHSGRKTIYSKTINADEITKEITIPVSRLGDGISHFTLFTKDLQPICERLYFKKPSSLLNVLVSTNKKRFATREKINIIIEQNLQEKPVSSNFSISVYETDSLTQGDDIASSLWLTSELSGKVENPSWYLKDASTEAIDILMLTHGWRRFDWKNALSVETADFKFKPELHGQIINAQITSATNAPLSNSSAYLSVIDQNFDFYTSPLNSNGDVNFYIKNFYGSKKIIAKVDPKVNNSATIKFNSSFSNQFANYQLKKFNKELADQKLLERSVGMQVHNAFYADYLKKQTIPIIDTSVFFHRPDKTYKLDDYVRFANMEDVLREYVFEVTVAKRNKDYDFRVFDSRTQKFLNEPPMILVDGFPLFTNANAMIKINPKIIKTINLVTSSYIYGNDKFDGIISLQTYNGNLNGIEIEPNVLAIDYEGLQLKRVFYVPMYDNDKSKLSRLADYRNTLFWSANNETQIDGKSNLSFYSGDLEGNYIIVVQALTPNGGAGSGHATFKVANNN